MEKIDISFIAPIAKTTLGDFFLYQITDPEIRLFIISHMGKDKLPNNEDLSYLAFQLAQGFIKKMKDMGIESPVGILSVSENEMEGALNQRLLRRVKDRLGMPAPFQ